MVGSPTDVVDLMEEWFTTGAADGFNVIPPFFPNSLDEFIALVVPELQRRGLYRTAYEGTTLRENLGLPRPASRYAGRAAKARPPSEADCDLLDLANPHAEEAAKRPSQAWAQDWSCRSPRWKRGARCHAERRATRALLSMRWSNFLKRSSNPMPSSTVTRTFAGPFAAILRCRSGPCGCGR